MENINCKFPIPNLRTNNNTKDTFNHFIVAFQSLINENSQNEADQVMISDI